MTNTPLVGEVAKEWRGLGYVSELRIQIMKRKEQSPLTKEDSHSNRITKMVGLGQPGPE